MANPKTPNFEKKWSLFPKPILTNDFPNFYDESPLNIQQIHQKPT